MRRVRMWRLALGLLAVVLVSAVGWAGVLAVWGGTSSLRYGPDSREERHIAELEARQDVQGLNEALLTTRSISGKMVILADLDHLRDDHSLPYLVKMLSYDLPWYDLLDSELEPRPHELRFAAAGTIAAFGQSKAEAVVRPLLDSQNPLERLHAAGILVRWGDPAGIAALDELVQGGSSRIAEEALWVKQALERR